MTNEITTLSPDIMSSLVLQGDLSKLNPTQKVEYYNALCQRIGLDPTTQPFKLLKLNNKEILYADKGATQQLSQVYKISHEVVKTEKIEDVYCVTVRAKTGDRYTDEMGAVTVSNLKGDMLANAMMKAVTKAKRRSVLALCGLGMLDESEIETIPNAKTIELKEPQALEQPKEIFIETPVVNNAKNQKIEIIEDLALKAFINKDTGKSSLKRFKEFLGQEFGIEKLSEAREEDLTPMINKLENIIKVFV